MSKVHLMKILTANMQIPTTTMPIIAHSHLQINKNRQLIVSHVVDFADKNKFVNDKIWQMIQTVRTLLFNSIIVLGLKFH